MPAAQAARRPHLCWADRRVGSSHSSRWVVCVVVWSSSYCWCCNKQRVSFAVIGMHSALFSMESCMPAHTSIMLTWHHLLLVPSAAPYPAQVSASLRQQQHQQPSRQQQQPAAALAPKPAT